MRWNSMAWDAFTSMAVPGVRASWDGGHCLLHRVKVQGDIPRSLRHKPGLFTDGDDLIQPQPGRQRTGLSVGVAAEPAQLAHVSHHRHPATGSRCPPEWSAPPPWPEDWRYSSRR